MVDEASLRPVFAVSFSGCDLRCDFCITGRSSWDPAAGTVVSGPGIDSEPLDGLAAAARRALGSGARSIMILGGEPTLHLPTVLDFVARLPEDALLVWKTNAHGTGIARELLEGLFDVWVADYKFGQDSCAERLARVPNYTEVVRENLRWASRHSRLIVRHLLMPGHLDCCWVPIARWLAEELPGVEVSLRDGFWPGWFSSRHPELSAPGSARDHARARRIGADLGLNLVD
jgi:putative pyruvate formate lyase activating enzyme